MISAKGAIIVGLSAVLAAIAAPPKLRAGTKIARHLTTHGQPYHLEKVLFRLPALANVDLATCADEPVPVGRAGCYLGQRELNLEAFHNLPQWQQDHVREWFVLLQNEHNRVDLGRMIRNLLRQEVTHDLSNMTENDFKAAFGAAERSLVAEEVGHHDMIPVFNRLDTNVDGTLSLQERMGAITGECEDQAGDLTLCTLYTQLLEPFFVSSPMTYDEWLEMFLSEGASVHEQVSLQFQQGWDSDN